MWVTLFTCPVCTCAELVRLALPIIKGTLYGHCTSNFMLIRQLVKVHWERDSSLRGKFQVVKSVFINAFNWTTLQCVIFYPLPLFLHLLFTVNSVIGYCFCGRRSCSRLVHSNSEQVQVTNHCDNFETVREVFATFVFANCMFQPDVLCTWNSK